MRRTFIFSLLLLLMALAVAGCARPWSHPDYSNSKQVEFHYKKDSTDCTILATDKHPNDKKAQDSEFMMCMEGKGWSKSENLSPFRD